MIDTTATPSEKETVFFNNLLVPVHPEYDFDAEPTQQFEYANPVVLNNKLILFTNAAIELTKQVVNLARRRERKRLERKDVDRRMRALEHQVLAKHPPPASATKNLKLTDAYVFQALEHEKLLIGYQQFETQVAALDDEIEMLKEEGENLRFTLNTIKIAGENIMTHLSWVKSEFKMGSRTPGPN